MHRAASVDGLVGGIASGELGMEDGAVAGSSVKIVKDGGIG
jgi:hypothetical protein